MSDGPSAGGRWDEDDERRATPSDTPITDALARDATISNERVRVVAAHKMRDLERVAKGMADALHLSGTRCEQLHHGKNDQHGPHVACPAEARVAAALRAWEELNK